jgi:hypothetical protein
MANTLGQYQPVLEWHQTVAVVGLVPQLGAGAVEGQDLQEVHVKGSEVAGILWLRVMDEQGGFNNSNVANCRFLGILKVRVVR